MHGSRGLNVLLLTHLESGTAKHLNASKSCWLPLPRGKHIVGKRYTQRVERTNLTLRTLRTLRTRLQRLVVSEKND